MYYKSKDSNPIKVKRPHSKRNRNKGRQLRTYQNKLNKLNSQYNQLVNHSQKSKTLYLAVKEEDRKPKNKVFFCDKYSTFDKFLAVNELRKVGSEETK